MTYSRTTLLTFAVVGVLVAGCGQQGTDTEGDAGTEPAPQESTTETSFNTVDVDFAQQMIPHHAQAIQMAQMVPDEGVSTELVELADAVEAAQQPEIDQLTAMLESWGQDAPATGEGHQRHESGDETGGMDHMGHHGGMEGMMSAEDMKAMEAASGAEFERTWLSMMIEHHQGAVTMSETVLADGSNAEAQVLAEQIIADQQAEIEQMTQMLDESDGQQ